MARRRTAKSHGPDPIDLHVGARLRLRRTLLGMSQEKLAGAIGLTFQQVQKYERGANRIGASRLWQLHQVLDVPVSFFFDDMQAGTGAAPHAAVAGDLEPDPAMRRETLELVRAYYRIHDPQIRRRLFELTKSIASASEAPAESAA